ncbi:MAG: tyrosine-type recombinase/integrase [Chloroflexia bacterium]|nr:tyrosine-type recombinase/integrase [Chloroflexia bacterium]
MVAAEEKQDGPVSLERAVEAYLEAIADSRTKSIVANHTSVSKSFLTYFEQRRPQPGLEELEKGDLLAFLDWQTHERGSFTPHTYNLALEFLKRLWRFALSRNWVEEDPAGEIAYQEIETPVPTVLTRQEMDRLIEAAREDDFQRALIGLLGELGLKKKELVALQFADLELDLPEPVVVIRYSGKLRKKSRRLPLFKDLAESLRRYRQQRQAEGDFSFLSPLVTVTGRQVNNILVRLSRQAGIRRVNPQILRDTAAVHLLANGRPPEEVSRTLGYTPRGHLLEFLPRFQIWIEPLPDVAPEE